MKSEYYQFLYFYFHIMPSSISLLSESACLVEWCKFYSFSNYEDSSTQWSSSNGDLEGIMTQGSPPGLVL